MTTTATPARRAKASARERVPTVTEKQIEKFIKPQLARNKVPGERVKAVLAIFGVKAVHELPIDKADEFVTACITPEPADPLDSDVPPDMEGSSEQRGHPARPMRSTRRPARRSRSRQRRPTSSRGSAAW
jgi:hypothetical protein